MISSSLVFVQTDRQTHTHTHTHTDDTKTRPDSLSIAIMQTVNDHCTVA